MNIKAKKLIEELKESLIGKVAALESFPTDVCFSFMDEANRFYLYVDSHVEMPAILTKLRLVYGNYRLTSYYMNHDNTLAVSYGFDGGFGVSCTFLCRDAADALKTVSNGKCSIVEKAKPSALEVVCSLDEQS